MMNLSSTRPPRSFVSEQLQINTSEDLAPYFDQLENATIENAQELEAWLKKRSELSLAISEDLGFRYVKMTCDTENKLFSDHYTHFIEQIEPEIERKQNALNHKISQLPYWDTLSIEGNEKYKKQLDTDLKLFREENLDLIAQITTESQQYGVISGDMTIDYKGNTYTLQQANQFLESTDRAVRQEVYTLIWQRRLVDKTQLNQLFDSLIKKRNQIAKNAGYGDYRDYMFDELHRYDYDKATCFSFHASVKKHVVPVLNLIYKHRKESLGYDVLRPWDLQVDPKGREALRPFKDDKDLLDKTITCLTNIDPQLGKMLLLMNQIGHLDLGSRKGKAPGGYNYPLDETGIPFIFMNAASQMQDVITLVHEAGHALHSFLMRDLPFDFQKNISSEVAELASMSMELMSMPFWSAYFDDQNDLTRACIEQFESVAETLCWVALIDDFQHKLYEQPDMSVAERMDVWVALHKEYSSSEIDWSGLEEYRSILWQKQLHLYEVPFYYIEYGIAQLGALAVYKQYVADPKTTFNTYFEALKTGATLSLPDTYNQCGIVFDFSEKYISDTVAFLKAQLSDLYDTNTI